MSLVDQSRHAPDACQTMDDVRYEIDRIDRALVRLISERTRYIEAAARIKPRRDQVRLPWRIEDVVAKVLGEARAAGAPSRIVEPVWRELIDRSIAHEFDEWARLRAAPSANGGEKATDDC